MALKLEGIRGKALKAAAHLDRINAAYDKFNEAAPAHAADVEGLTPQIEALHEDLQFATQVLGNSVGASGEAQDLSKLSPAVPQPEPQTNAQAIAASSPAVGPAAVTFQAAADEAVHLQSGSNGVHARG